MLNKLWEWLDEKTGLPSALNDFLYKPVPRNLGWVFSLGSAALFLLGLQAITGIFLALYYAPTPDHAYDSLRYVESRVTFGRLIRGFHHWGASLMVITVGLHMVRVVIFGSYKKPREATWVIGVLLFLCVMGFGFTGYLLPWDQKAYWATVVGTQVAGSVPVVGEMILRVMRGGTEVGALTLTRFYALHVLVLPAATFALVGLHLMLIRKWGISGPWRRPSGAVDDLEPFYPTQVFKDTVGMAVVLVLLVALTTLAGVPMEGRADVTDTTYQPKPEWYFLSLYQLLKYLPGAWEVVGTTLLPMVGLLVLFALPWLDRGEERSPARRGLVTGGVATTVAAVVTLTVLGYVSPTPGGGASEPPQAPSGLALSPDLEVGLKVYTANNCQFCHRILGKGGEVGPDLTRVGASRTADWIRVKIVNPKQDNPASTMPSYSHLPKKDLDALVGYLSSLKK